MTKRTWIYTLLAALLIVLLASCQPAGQTGAAKKTKSGTTLAKVGSETITLEEFNAKLEKIPPFYKRRVATKKGKLEYLDRLINEDLFYQEAIAKGLNKDSEFLEQLESIKKSILAGKIKKNLMEEKKEITDEEAKKHFDENPEDYKTPETVTVKHILFRVRRGDSEDREKEIQAKADKVYAELTGKKISFDAAAKKYSDDKGSAKKGGKLPPIRKGLKSKEFDEVAFKMTKNGEISKPFKDRRGFNILMFEEKSESNLKEYEKVEKQIKRKLAQEVQKNAMESFTTELRKKYPVEIKEDLLGDDEGAGEAPGIPDLPKLGGKKIKLKNLETKTKDAPKPEDKVKGAEKKDK